MKVHKIISLFLVIGTMGCYYDVEEELYPTVECMTADMSYSQDVVPLLQKDCYVCHSSQANFGNVSLDSHAKLMVYVSNGKLIGSIKHDPGFSPMPKGKAKMLDCEIEKIQAWISQGAINN